MARSGEDKDAIIVNYYQGAYGPTIRIDIQMRMKLMEIYSLFQQLALSNIEIVNFAQQQSVKTSELDELILQVVPHNKERRKKLELVRSKLGRKIFCWSMSPESWEDCVAKTESLMEDDTPAHQYLTEEGIDDALVELAYME